MPESAIYKNPKRSIILYNKPAKDRIFQKGKGNDAVHT